MSIIFIYGLVDPRSKNVRYIGKSINLEKRYKAHTTSKANKTKKEKWINSLKNLGLSPLIIVLKITNSQEYEYWEEFYIKHYKSQQIDLCNYDDRGVGTLHIKPPKSTIIKIHQYDLNGNKIDEYTSMREASKKTGINHGNIGRVCRYVWKHSGGFIFRYANDKKKIEPLKNANSVKKRVCKIDKYGNVCDTYPSIAIAASKNNIDASKISRICNGKIKSKKFKFETYE